MRKFVQAAKYSALGGLVAAGNAMAELPVEVTTAISDAKTDGLTVAGGFLAAIIVISALLIARRGAKG
ncbi:MAG: major capsid protein [Rhodocyclaceae bacterium]|nr:major capsid protein [Rhodocyclaceae bacterium]